MNLLFIQNLQRRVLTVQGSWHSPNPLPTMIHIQNFCIIAKQPHIERAPLSTTWGRTRQLCGSSTGILHQYSIYIGPMINYIIWLHKYKFGRTTFPQCHLMAFCNEDLLISVNQNAMLVLAVMLNFPMVLFRTIQLTFLPNLVQCFHSDEI